MARTDTQPRPVSQAYVMGIKEGRLLLNSMGGDVGRVEMADMLDNIKSTLRGMSGDVAEMLRGERDFWKNQLRSN